MKDKFMNHQNKFSTRFLVLMHVEQCHVARFCQVPERAGVPVAAECLEFPGIAANQTRVRSVLS